MSESFGHHGKKALVTGAFIETTLELEPDNPAIYPVDPGLVLLDQLWHETADLTFKRLLAPTLRRLG